MRMPLIRAALVLLAAGITVLLEHEAAFAAGIHTIEGTVTRKAGSQSQPMAALQLLLEDGAGTLVEIATTDDNGRYRFEELEVGIYRVVATDPPGTQGRDAAAGVPRDNVVRIDGNTLQVSVVPGVQHYSSNNFVKVVAVSSAERVSRLLEIGQGVPLERQSGFFEVEALDLDPGKSTIRRVTDDGSLFVLDPAGSALLRVRAGNAEVILDTTDRDPVDGVSLNRLLQVETGRDGISAVHALRADNTRGIYRLEAPRRLSRLALLFDASDSAEMAIGDRGQVAYVAHSASVGAAALFQTSGRESFELLRQGQIVLSDAVITPYRDSTGRQVVFGDLTGNDAGDLAFRILLTWPTGVSAWALVRKTSSGMAVIAYTSLQVQTGRGSLTTGWLVEPVEPRIGPEGTVVFLGIGPRGIGGVPLFTNIYAARPGQGPQPLLPSASWHPEPVNSDYEISAEGTVALRVTRLPYTEAELYLVPPTGEMVTVLARRLDIQPVGRPAFGPGGRLYFQARNPDWTDGSGREPVGLFRYRPGQAEPTPVAVPGQVVPSRQGAQILGIPQRPLVTETGVAFAGLFGGGDRFPVPTAGLFHVPLEGTLSDSSLLAEQGVQLPSIAQVVAFRDFYYAGDGSLIFDTFVRWGLVIGQLIGTLASEDSTASALPLQNTQAVGFSPLLLPGHDLGESRKLQRVLGPLVALGSDKKLFTAKFSQGAGAGEGLFIVNTKKEIAGVAVSGALNPAHGPGLAGARFISFGEAVRNGDRAPFAAYVPSVSPDGNVVFKARVERNGSMPTGLFRWSTGGAPTVLALSDTALSPGDPLPYDLTQWAAGRAGRAYFLAQPQQRSNGLVSRLFEHSASGLTPLVVAGQTPIVAGGASSILADMFDFVINGSGDVYLHGTQGTESGLFRIEPGQLATDRVTLTPVARQAEPLPATAEGKRHPGLIYGSALKLRRDSACGDLVFEAEVLKPQVDEWQTRGLFRHKQGSVETLLVQSLGMADWRHPVIASIPPDEPCEQPVVTQSISQQQPVTRTVAFAGRHRDGRWSLYRSRRVRDDVTGEFLNSIVLIAQEAPGRPSEGQFISLDPSLLLGRPTNSGPVFRVNAAGDVAFMASDGQRWAIYRYADRP